MPTKTADCLTIPTDAMTQLLAPTGAEILQITWREGATTVAHGHRRRSQQRALAYTTIQTPLERPAEKSLLQWGKRQGVGGAVWLFLGDRRAGVHGPAHRGHPQRR